MPRIPKIHDYCTLNLCKPPFHLLLTKPVVFCVASVREVREALRTRNNHLRKNPKSFHARMYFLARSKLTGPAFAKVLECSLLFVVSRISPPHDMRRKCSSRNSMTLRARLSVSMEPGKWRTRCTHFSKGITSACGIPSASARTEIISRQGCRAGFSIW